MFKSDSAARWATVFDKLDIHWEYNDLCTVPYFLIQKPVPAFLLAEDEYPAYMVAKAINIADQETPVILLPPEIPDPSTPVWWYPTVFWSSLTDSLCWKYSPLKWIEKKRIGGVFGFDLSADPTWMHVAWTAPADFGSHNGHGILKVDADEMLTEEEAKKIPLGLVAEQHKDGEPEPWYQTLVDAYTAGRGDTEPSARVMDDLDLAYIVITHLHNAVRLYEDKKPVEAQSVLRSMYRIVGEFGGTRVKDILGLPKE